MSTKKAPFPTDSMNFSQSAFLQPGRKAVMDMLEQQPGQIESVLLAERHGPGLNKIIELCRQVKVRFSFVPGPALDRLYPGPHQGVVARVFAPGFIQLDDLLERAISAPLPVIVALDQVKDPGNLGTLARTLLALGGAGLIIPSHQSAGLGPGAAKAAAGALSRLPLGKVVNLGRALDQAAERGFHIYAAEANGQNVFTLEPELPAVLVLGSEGTGLRPGIAKRCQASLAIPMSGPMESLNLAQAGAIILGQFLRITTEGSTD